MHITIADGLSPLWSSRWSYFPFPLLKQPDLTGEVVCEWISGWQTIAGDSYLHTHLARLI
jgi:hypothetical protein